MTDLRYQVLQELPGVGRRRVYRARDAATNGIVALKVVPASEVTRELAALMAARLPGVVELVDHYVDGPEATIVTRWIDGLPFPGPVTTLEVVVRAATALLDVIERVHRCGVVHRDLKPTNVLVDADGRVNVLDLGIAAGAGVERHTDDGDIAGTLRYLAPEQLVGTVDHRADLYAIGVMVYEVLTGALPHDGTDLVGERLLNDPVPVRARRPELSGELAAVVDRLVARRPDDRFADAGAAARALGAGAPSLLPPGRPTARWLRSVLRGPEVVGQLRSRAATLLWRRSRGRRERVDELLSEWERSGVVTPDLVVDPARFEALEAADRDAALLARWARGTSEERVATALWESERCLQEGRHERAVTLLRATMADEPPLAAAAPLVDAWARHALALATTGARQELALTLRRWGEPTFEPLLRVLDAADRVQRGDTARALAELQDQDSLLAHVVRVQAARLASLDVHEAATARFERWAAAADEEALATNARGLLLYRVGRFQDAARAHQRAARTATVRSAALAARLNAGIAWMQVPDVGKALRAGEAALAVARRLRHAGHQAIALVLIRDAQYRLGLPPVDDDLEEALVALGMVPLAATAALTRAAAAWRRREPDALARAVRAEELATQSGRRSVALLAGGLASLLGGAAHHEGVGDEVPAGVAAQVLALRGAAARSRALREAARERAPWAEALGVRREILTPAEVLGADFA